MCAPPPCTKWGGGAHSPAGEGLGEPQFRRLKKKLSTLPTLLCVLILFYAEKWRANETVTKESAGKYVISNMIYCEVYVYWKSSIHSSEVAHVIWITSSGRGGGGCLRSVFRVFQSTSSSQEEEKGCNVAGDLTADTVTNQQ